MTITPFQMEAETLCDLAETATEHLEPLESSDELCRNIKAVVRRLRSIISEQPESHNDINAKQQFHREVAEEKGLLR